MDPLTSTSLSHLYIPHLVIVVVVVVMCVCVVGDQCAEENIAKCTFPVSDPRSITCSAGVYRPAETPAYPSVCSRCNVLSYIYSCVLA